MAARPNAQARVDERGDDVRTQCRVVCWFESGAFVIRSACELRARSRAGLAQGEPLPHYDGEVGRRPAYHEMVGRKTINAGYAADDGAALHYIGRRLHRVVSSRPNAKVYRVSRSGRGVIERELPTEYLGTRGRG